MAVRNGSQADEPGETPPIEAVETVSGYRDLARVGNGGFSVVYRAVQESFERDVALKVLTVGSDEEARRRFLREVRLASKVSGHPHVVTVLDTGTTASGRPYLAMDLYDEGSMKERVKRTGPLPAAEVAVVGAKIAEALAAAHSVGVLHRDVKPNNILVSRFGEPALADFGVSCLLDSHASASVLDVFSPQHAAPELMARGVPSVSCDVYALGSTLYELLTGRPPFGAAGLDVRAIMWRVMSEPAPRPDCPQLPGLADAIVRALAKEPRERFPDAAGFAKALRALIPDGAMAAPAMAAATAAAIASAAGPDGPDPAASAVDAAYASSDAGASSDAEHEPAADETMFRPDRAEPGPGPKTGKPERDLRRLRTPLIVLGALCLLGAAVWIVLASQNPSTGAHGAAAVHHATAGATPTGAATHAASAKPTPGATHTATHSAVPAAAETTQPARASAGASAAGDSSPTSSSGLSGLLGIYHRYQNAQSGGCLEAAASAVGQQPCGGGDSEGWEFSEPVTGILNAVSGEFELVDKASGDCLAAGPGAAVGAQPCAGGTAQLWSTVSGPGGDELRNAGDGECLTSSGSGVLDGTCASGSSADLWSQTGM